MTKIIHIQKSVLSTGRAPLRLHNAMLEENIDSSIFSLDFDVNLTDRIKVAGRNSRIKARLDDYFQSVISCKVKRQFGMFSYVVIGSDVSAHEFVRNADIIYLHWVQGGFMNLSNYRQLANLGKPVIIFMHDMWSITGGCHHSFDCDKYKKDCFKCQMFPEESKIDWAHIEFRKKKKLYSDFKNIYFVSPSKWLYNCARQSFLTIDKPVFHIPNIVDTRLYKPVGRKLARKLLSIDENDTIVAFGAFSISSAYKGWNELLKALNILSSGGLYKDLTVLVFGGGYDREIADKIQFKTRFMGFLKDEYSTVLVYNSIDVFVTPSLADNFPTTVLECQACGTPVVGFDVGGIPDIIKHRENGYLAKYRDPEDLANGISFCLENKTRGYLLPSFEMGDLVRKHKDLIASVTK
jgi:glycosyltransferase involved in cell wall biosynthesis